MGLCWDWIFLDISDSSKTTVEVIVESKLVVVMSQRGGTVPPKFGTRDLDKELGKVFVTHAYEMFWDGNTLIGEIAKASECFALEETIDIFNVVGMITNGSFEPLTSPDLSHHMLECGFVIGADDFCSYVGVVALMESTERLACVTHSLSSTGLHGLVE